ncbi:hypothetical protein [Flammeovirga aprica]|uniref:Uncharacterized protein n=1 Tax=Flammeovirga aprica JL-4 TaxID=694437 RepID=A0A7X9RXE0_9BACT|nr:hypothetical protein [Flammeovirga aprica]NME70447.1 hypothetical protein [Flammeovirga aprica JL-4]
MPKFILLLIFISHSVIGQNTRTDKRVSEKFHEFFYYVPKPSTSNSEANLKSKYSSFNQFSLEKLFVLYDRTSPSINDIIFLERQIISLSENLFKEKKYILLEAIGGASGCVEPWYEEKEIDGRDIKIIRLCSGCSDYRSNYHLVVIYNAVMNQLLGIEPEAKHVMYSSRNFVENSTTTLDFDLVERTYSFINIETKEMIDKGFWTKLNGNYFLVSAMDDSKNYEFALTKKKHLKSTDIGKFKLIQ